MPRNRTLKTSIFSDDKLYDAEVATGLPLRIALLGLWTAADREGRLRSSPRVLKHSCLPFDDLDFGDVLSALTAIGYLATYTVDGVAYGYIVDWDQPIHHREPPSTIPPPNLVKVSSAPAEAAREPRPAPPPQQRPPVAALPMPRPPQPQEASREDDPPTPDSVTENALDDLIRIAFMGADREPPPDMARIPAWLDAGYPPEVCLGEVKKAIAAGEDIPKLAALDVRIRTEIVRLRMEQGHG